MSLEERRRTAAGRKRAAGSAIRGRVGLTAVYPPSIVPCIRPSRVAGLRVQISDELEGWDAASEAWKAKNASTWRENGIDLVMTRL